MSKCLCCNKSGSLTLFKGKKTDILLCKKCIHKAFGINEFRFDLLTTVQKQRLNRELKEKTQKAILKSKRNSFKIDFTTI